jgi:DNA-binding protein YbaB
MVRVVLSGKYEVIEVHIDPKVHEAGDHTLLEDLVRAAFNQAAAQVAERVRERMGGLAQGLGIDLSALGFPDGKP